MKNSANIHQQISSTTVRGERRISRLLATTQNRIEVTKLNFVNLKQDQIMNRLKLHFNGTF